VITYNTILNGYVKAQQIDQCFELFERMRAKSTAPSQVTYGILLEGCINGNQLDRAVQVLDDMTAAGSPMNTILYTTLIKGFARAGKLESAMDMYGRMKADNKVLPDAYTFSILIKANCDHAYLEEALKLFAEMVAMGLKPDEIVFNNMLSGCAHFGSVSLGEQLYENMVSSGVRPSSATYSILIQLYHRCKRLGDAVEMLRVEPAKCKVELEPRLFLQLIQCCIRERQGKRAVEVYCMFAQQSPPTAAAHSSMLSTCMKSKMYEIAAEIVSLAAESGAHINACDTTSVLDAAFQKRKTHVVQRLVASMITMGHHLDQKFTEDMEPNSLSKSSDER
jgi:pentatricopeptide repeat domain-containing protein 1